MGKFVTQSLLDEETVEYEADVSWSSQIGNFVIALVFVVAGESAVKVFALVFVVMAFISILNVELALTNKKVIGKSGLVRIDSIDIPIQKLESISVDQGVFGRMLGYGHVTVRGVGGNAVSIKNIKDPMAFRKEVMKAMDKQ